MSLKDRTKKSYIVFSGWKWGNNKKSSWAKIKSTFFTPIGTHQSSPRKQRQRKSRDEEAELEDGVKDDQVETMTQADLDSRQAPSRYNLNIGGRD